MAQFRVLKKFTKEVNLFFWEGNQTPINTSDLFLTNYGIM